MDINDDQLPGSATDMYWQKYIAPYITPKLFRCPADATPMNYGLGIGNDEYSYTYNRRWYVYNILGGKTTTFKSPTRCMVLIDGANASIEASNRVDSRLRFRHNARANISFLDGHVDDRTRDQVWTCMANYDPRIVWKWF